MRYRNYYKGGGKIEKAIDFVKLRAELGDVALDAEEERYQFTWPDKSKASRLANTPTTMTLRPCREESVEFENTENLYIEGDNLEVLKILRETYLGKVKMIYIDPPYNTGNDFVYNDDFSQSKEEFEKQSGFFDEDGNQTRETMIKNSESNGRFHTDWLNMMYPRLKIARELLSEDGVIFISIDEKENQNLRKVCDEIFGERNLVSQIPWQSRASIQNDTDFSINHEYIVCYAKNRRQEKRRLKESNFAEWHKRNSFVCRPLPLDLTKFDNPDNDPRGKWKSDPFDAPNIRPNLTYPITNPNTGETFWPPEGRHWRTEQEQFEIALKDNRIRWGANGKGRPQLKVFYEEKKDLGSIDNSWFSAEKVGTATQGTKELMNLFDGAKIFDTPKPVSLLVKLLELSNLHSNDIVLDFFSGSATTAEAVMLFNSKTNLKVKYVLAQIPELCSQKSMARKKGFNNICEIGKERIRRAGQKILKQNLSTQERVDTGFRNFKLDSSNMKEVYYTPDKFIPETLSLFIDNVKPDRTPEDLLFQTMNSLGIELSAKIQEKQILNKKVFSVDDGYLLACFDESLTEDVIDEMAQLLPTYLVIRNTSVDQDSILDNFNQIVKSYSMQKEIKIKVI